MLHYLYIPRWPIRTTYVTRNFFFVFIRYENNFLHNGKYVDNLASLCQTEPRNVYNEQFYLKFFVDIENLRIVIYAFTCGGKTLKNIQGPYNATR